MKKIPLTQGKYTLVDDADYEWLNRWKWCAMKNHYAWYVIRGISLNGRNRKISMHREILGLKRGDGKMTDHIDGNGLNNTRSNLRVCNYRENNRNRHNVQGVSKYFGVCRRGNNNWRAQIRYDGKNHHLGTFSSEIDAAKAYDEAARRHHGGFTSLNFNQSNSEEAQGGT